MKSKYDVVVIGAGCIGVSVASHLGDMGCTNVLVIEKEKMIGTGATAKCAGGVRAQFSTPINIHMSHYSINEFEKLDAEYGIQFVQCGYLFVVKTEEQKAQYLRNMEIQKKYGVDVRFVSKDEISKLAPNYGLEKVLGGTFGAKDGLVDPYMMVDAYFKKSRKMNIEFETDMPCTGLKGSNGNITHVVTPQGEIACDYVVNAAGPFAKEIGAFVGVEIPIEPLRRMITTTGALDFMSDAFPMVVDVTTGMYMHKEGNGLLIGLANNNEKPGYDETIDNEFLDTMLMTALEVMPYLENAEIKTKYPGTWAGLYETTPDHHSILDRVPNYNNFIIAGGFSGHGLMHAPAAGHAAAELIIKGKSDTFDLHPVRFSRFAEGDLTVEKNVI
ncbi:FAD-binding oxidoreductase [bacterium]|nr:FAD-binding oxidoreductase [bacterium]